MKYDVEPLFEAPYWLIDIFPAQVPPERAEEYLRVERSYLNSAKLDELYARFSAILAVVSGRYQAMLFTLPEESETEYPNSGQIFAEVRRHARRGAVQLYLTEENALLTLNAEDLYMTVYQPSERLQAFLKETVAAAGLYFRQPEQLKRIEHYERIFNEAQRLLNLKARTSGETAALQRCIQHLEVYYGSDDWKKDFADDGRGLLPQNMPRGVLSEDGVFNLLDACRE